MSCDNLCRCGWALGDEAMIRYHDLEWGTPVYDDRLLFEFLILEGAQAGLSWRTILHRRETYRAAFDGFDPEIVAGYGPKKIEALLRDPGIIRNRLKVEGAVKNAKAFLATSAEFGGFAPFIWKFVEGRPRINRPQSLQEIPATTAQSDAMSKELKKRGFTFVGSTICYAFMQAVGMVDDHVAGCFRAT
jgi:DNA-3-methyladenine glycosylase I